MRVGGRRAGKTKLVLLPAVKQHLVNVGDQPTIGNVKRAMTELGLADSIRDRPGLAEQISEALQPSPPPLSDPVALEAWLAEP